MDETERDRISKGFSDLTALPEDAEMLAIDGQSRKRTVVLISEDIGSVRTKLIASVAVPALIDRRVDGKGNSQIR